MAADEIRRFLDVVDAGLVGLAGAGETLPLHLLGRSALVLGYGLRLMTKDVDVVHLADSRLLEAAVGLFGRTGRAVSPGGLYLETVSSGLPPLPIGYAGRLVEVAGDWEVIRPRHLEAHDLIVTKLRRFHAGDREDVRILCDSGEVDPATLRDRFELAHAFSDRDDPAVVGSAEHLAAVVQYLEGRRRSL